MYYTELMNEALDILVKGIVQGVGFRPFVYKLAKRYLLTGWVLNAIDGVHIHVEGNEKHLDEFVLELSENAPQAAHITEIELHEVPLQHLENFEIRFSEDEDAEHTLVSPELATCPDCVNELFNKEDRRYRYPFINCTNCGPRFTITNELPYDRKNTSMATFPLCADCIKEYENPEDRRFHAQPNACFQCGPHLTWRTSFDIHEEVTDNEQALKAAISFLLEGKIVAVKSLGGFHLMCDASNDKAVADLRTRKGRDGKAFAVLLPSADAAEKCCVVSDDERALLEGSQRPIVLLRKAETFNQSGISNEVSQELSELGVMLPYTPVHHLLLHDFAEAKINDGKATSNCVALVATSGNVHDNPIITQDAEAYEMLSSIADGFLGNNREIVARFDDSVVRVLHLGEEGSAVQFIRRARGYAPAPLQLQSAVSQPDPKCDGVFATGPEQKNTFTFLCNTQAFVSQHIGDVENVQVFDFWMNAQERYKRLFGLSPSLIATDLHPEYLTSKWAADQHLPVEKVQHQYAHIVSCMAENNVAGPVAGIAFDGTGFGADGNIWGGEVLLCNLTDYERFANFSYVPMPGGSAAIKNPLRMAYGVLWQFDLLDHPGAQQALELLGKQQASTCEQMIENGINTPYTSSCGRLFDAASALLGICTQPSYEGEAAVLLEAAAWRSLASDGPNGGTVEKDNRYTVSLVKNTAHEGDTAQTTSVILLDAEPAFTALLDDLAQGIHADVIARKFHDAIVDAILISAQAVLSLYEISTIALSGGVFMNRYLCEQAIPKLVQNGCTVLLNRELPPNDGCVSLGQAVVAAHKAVGEQEPRN